MSKGHVRSWEEWAASVPETIKRDALWQLQAYRLALFVSDLCWHDATKLSRDPRTRGLADQLYRAVGSIGANIAEGYSRRSGKVKAQFYEYALGSARESRDWCYRGRHVLGEDVVSHRMGIFSEIIRLLLAMIQDQRHLSRLKEPGETYLLSTESISKQGKPAASTSLLTPHSSLLTLASLSSLPPQVSKIESSLESHVTARRGETVMVAGEGCWMVDAQGRRYLDMTSAQGVAMLGYGHPALAGAVGEQVRRLHVCPSFFYNDVRAAFLQALMEVTPPHLTRAFLCNSGAEAVDGAIKFARLATGRPGLVAARNGFHGRTVGAVSLTWNPRYRRRFEPLLPQVRHVPFNDLAALDAAVDQGTAAVVLEPIQGEGGVHPATPEFLQGAASICRERGALLVLDEIQTGFGRTGRWFALEHYGVEPDILCLAKGIGGGFPMGAIVYTDQVQEALFPGAHGSTFGGNPLACAAGLAAIRTYQEEGLVQWADRAGTFLRERLEERIGGLPLVREIRGLGLMVGIELRRRVGKVLRALMEEHRVLALPGGPNVLRLLPPLIVSQEELELAVEAIGQVLETI